MNGEYRPKPNSDSERLIQQIQKAGIPRWIAEAAIIKHDMELTSRVAYA